MIHQKLTNDYEIIVTRSIVRNILKVLDPSIMSYIKETIHCEKTQFLWHIDDMIN